MLVRFATNPFHSSPANDNADPFVARSMKDLLCDGCGRRPFTRFGFCEECLEDARAEAEERRTFHPDAEG